MGRSPLRTVWLGVAGAGFMLAAAGCDGGAEAGDVGAVAGDQATLTVGRDFCVFGGGGIVLDDRAVANGLVGAGRSLQVGNDARINGATLVNGPDVLGDRVRIVGDLTLAATLRRGNNDVVTGTIRQNTPVTLPALFAQSVPAGTMAVTVGPGANVTLRPGAFGAVVIGARSVVRLSGTYDIRSFTVEPDVTLIQDPPGAAIHINAVGAISFGDRVVLRATDPTNVLVFSAAANSSPVGAGISVGTQSSITAIIDGPAANVVIRSRARINGCVGAGRQLTLEPDAVIASSNPNATLPLQPSP